MRKNVVVASLMCASAGGAIAVARVTPVPFASAPAALPHKPGIVEDVDARMDATERESPVALAERNRVAAAEAAKIAQRERARGAHPLAAWAPDGVWVSLGPTDAPSEANDTDIDAVDSGRPNAIVADPRDPNIVYLAESGGGVWKTFDLQAPGGPHWFSVDDTLPNPSIGALAMDPGNPDTLYLGTGDAFDLAGNTVQKTSDGGVTWSAPVTLTGTYPAPNNLAAPVRDIRALVVRDGVIFATTSAGLFKSTDGGASFALVDLPNAHGKVLAESMWSVVPLGGGQWIASGMTACDETGAGRLPPRVRGVDPGPACPEGNDGVLWRSVDGTTWTQVTTPYPTNVGRISLAAGDSTDPAHTVVYAYVSAVGGQKTRGFWRSKDGGVTWVDITTALANPTLGYDWPPHDPTSEVYSDCPDLDIGSGQSYYNQAIAVDPTNPDHVLVGGQFCSMRTLNGTADAPTWELISHWLPSGGGGTTRNGTLKYAHADWHTASVSLAGGSMRVFVGNDGGIYESSNVFSPDTQAEKVEWKNYNRGLATHLLQSLISGDPTTGFGSLLYGGLQDNGTRFRLNPARPAAFDQVIGGDGLGGAVHVATSGTTWWASYYGGSRMYCQPDALRHCDSGSSWRFNAPQLDPAIPVATPASERELEREGAEEPRDGEGEVGPPAGKDGEPFRTRFANVETDTDGQTVLTNSFGRVWAAVLGADKKITWKPISQDVTVADAVQLNNVYASRTIKGLYGAVTSFSKIPAYVTTTGDVIPPDGTAPTPWKASQPVFATGTTARLTGPMALDFPPVQPTGTVPGQVYIVGFNGIMSDGTAGPDDKGRLWRTTDYGQTWTSIVGADPAHRLPNVGILVVKYDPMDAGTIYVGNELGVYVSRDDGVTWDRLGHGLPMVQVRDLYIAKNDEFIRIGTYGRGFWEIYPSATASHGADGSGDYDRNQRIDWVDLAAMSSRLGSNPTTTTAPLYTWIEDVTGAGTTPPVRLIDDSDLAVLLSKFGGHP
jgi:hypothetical protein